MGITQGHGDSKRTLGGSKVDHVAVLLKHVNLINGLDGLDVHLLQSSLELLVIGARGLVDLLDLPSGSTLSAVDSIKKTPVSNRFA